MTDGAAASTGTTTGTRAVADAGTDADAEDTSTPAGDAGGEDTSDADDAVTVRRTRRWWAVEFALLALFAAGLATMEPTLFALVGVGVVFETYAGVRAGDDGSALELDREVSRLDPSPGDPVEVTLTLRNTGSGFVADARVVDGVPGALEVSDGSPRFATALRPGREATHSYEIRAARGEHTFPPATVAVRSLGGAVEHERTLDAATTLTCSLPLSEVPLRAQTSIFSGRLPTDVGGSGTEFHSVREYRSTDPLNRIDWRRYARTNEFATVSFREERAATVVLLVDARPAAYWTAEPDDRHAVDHAVAAAGQVYDALVENGDRVGITVVDAYRDAWLAPAAGQAALTAARHFLAVHPELAYDPPDDLPELVVDPEHDPVDPSPLLARLPDDAQVVAFAPLCDDGIVGALERLEASGHATTVISPNVTRTDTDGHRLARAQRANRIGRLRGTGIRVVDWPPTRNLAETLLAEARAGGGP